MHKACTMRYACAMQVRPYKLACDVSFTLGTSASGHAESRNMLSRRGRETRYGCQHGGVPPPLTTKVGCSPVSPWSRLHAQPETPSSAA
jgi:hypothetical protein